MEHIGAAVEDIGLAGITAAVIVERRAEDQIDKAVALGVASRRRAVKPVAVCATSESISASSR
jgi:hypothetical protein